MLFDVKNLRITLPSGACVVDSVSFQISDGEMLSIVGSSGAGKTTVCKAIMGLLGSGYHVSGEMQYKGENLLNLTERKRQQIYGNEICYIMQNPMTAFNPSLRVGRQLEKTYFQHNRKISKAELHDKIAIVLHRLGLEDPNRILKSYPFALSGGMLQRLMIAAALINQPKLLVADEVTTAIDACNRMELMRELKTLCDDGLAVLFVTHDLRSAKNADQILIMNSGAVIESGKTEQILHDPGEEYTKHLLNACQLDRRDSA